MRKLIIFLSAIFIFNLCTVKAGETLILDLNNLDMRKPAAKSAELYHYPAIPAIMYHDITENENELSDYRITYSQLEADFRLLKELGFTPLTASEFAYIKANINNSAVSAELNEKYPNPILITIDDGYESGYTDFFKLLKEYNFKANFFLIGKYIGEAGYMTAEQIREMSDSGLCEFGNHTYELHDRSPGRLSVLYDQRDISAISADLEKNKKLIEEITAKECISFSYPYGFSNDTTDACLHTLGATVSFNSFETVASIKKIVTSIPRYNRAYQLSTQSFIRTIVLNIRSKVAMNDWIKYYNEPYKFLTNL